MSYQLPPVLQRIDSLGFKVFDGGAFDLNLFGIRSASKVAGPFDDLLGCAYRETADGPWRVAYWPGTTDPGVYWLEQGRVDGTAILVPGQYRGTWKLGKHRGQYRALVQTGGKVRVYRDANKDDQLDHDPESVAEGYFGINIHKAGKASTSVHRWSAGCQVHATEAGFKDMLRLVDAQLRHHPTWDSFTYTLLDSWF